LKKYKFSSIKAYNVDATKLVSQVTKNDALLLNPDLLKVLNIENESFSYDTIEQFLPSEEQKISLNQKSKNILRNKNTDGNSVYYFFILIIIIIIIIISIIYY